MKLQMMQMTRIMNLLDSMAEFLSSDCEHLADIQFGDADDDDELSEPHAPSTMAASAAAQMNFLIFIITFSPFVLLYFGHLCPFHTYSGGRMYPRNKYLHIDIKKLQGGVFDYGLLAPPLLPLLFPFPAGAISVTVVK